MTKALDYIIPRNDEHINQKFYDYRIRKNGIVFTYTNGSPIIIWMYNLIKEYTLEDVYIENVSDSVFIDLLTKYDENRYITLLDIREILSFNKCILSLVDSKEKEWNFCSYTKWIVLKKKEDSMQCLEPEKMIKT